MSRANVTSFKISLSSSENQVLQFKGPLHSSKFILQDAMDMRSSWRGKLHVRHPQLNIYTNYILSVLSVLTGVQTHSLLGGGRSLSHVSSSQRDFWFTHTVSKNIHVSMVMQKHDNKKLPLLLYYIFPTMHLFNCIYFFLHSSRVLNISEK